MFNQLVYSICWGKMTMSCILWTTWISCYGSKERASDDIKSTELAVYSMLSCYRCQEDTYQVPSCLLARFLSSLMAPQMLQLPTNSSKTQRVCLSSWAPAWLLPCPGFLQSLSKGLWRLKNSLHSSLFISMKTIAIQYLTMILKFNFRISQSILMKRIFFIFLLI